MDLNSNHTICKSYIWSIIKSLINIRSDFVCQRRKLNIEYTFRDAILS